VHSVTRHCQSCTDAGGRRFEYRRHSEWPGSDVLVSVRGTCPYIVHTSATKVGTLFWDIVYLSAAYLTFCRMNYFFLILAHPVYKM